MGPAPVGKTSDDYPPECAFALVCECINMQGRPNMPGHLYFAPVPGRIVPVEKDKLRHELELAARSLRDLYKGKDLASDFQFQEYFRSLLSAAQLGLLCENADPAQGRAALETLKLTVLESELQAVKTAYLNKLGVWTAAVGIVCVAVGLLMYFKTAPAQPTEPRPSNFAFMLAAVMPMMWVSFITREQVWSFDNLCRPEADLIQPWHRIVYVACFTALLALICGVGIVGISIANFSTSKIAEHLPSAIIFGAACGFSEKLLATTVAPQLKRILEAIGKGPPK